MSLELHPNCISRLTEAVAENLVHIRVDNDVFLNFESTLELESAEKILPETGKIQDKLSEYVGERALFEFIYESISRDIYESGTYDEGKKDRPLTSLPGYEDPTVVASRLIQEFNSLPWNYLVSLELPVAIGTRIRGVLDRFELSDNLRIVSPDESYDTVYPLQSGNEQRDRILFRGSGFSSILRLGKTEAHKWNRDTVYLQADAKGFIGRQWTSPAEAALSVFRSFVGLSMAVHLLMVNEEQIFPPFRVPEESHLIVHCQVSDAWQIWVTLKLPLDLSETLSRLDLDNLDGRVKDERISDYIKGRLPMISTAFQNPDKAERVLLAGQWLLDSYMGKNELLSFVQTAVAMEILLGEEAKSDVIGIGELLRNRCAYLIGTTRSQREEILNDFGKIYDVRSKIVHRGKSKLNYEEKTLFQKLRWMCRRVIHQELKLISEDKAGAA